MRDDERKPNPDELLRSIAREESRADRGRLRIFLGMCPGVGKTYAMLQAAREKQRSGVRTLVGIVETHGRPETEALLQGLPVVERKKIEYRGKVFEELDVDAVLQAAPAVALVDELAHTNIPGSRHPKRYHDVQDLLEAGIDVYTTMNVQHLESRVDLVKQITGITVHERVPDSFFELAEQVELVDLPPSELLKRLKEGKVYLGEMAGRAAEGFFQEEHLLALRELALRFTAEVVEGELHDQMLRKQIAGPWQTRERLLVAISHSPYSKRLIRAARRAAAGKDTPWIALYIDNGETLSDDDKAMLRRNMDLARELGAELISIRDPDIPLAIRRVAEEKNVTQILMGRPDRRFFRDWIRGGTILDKLVRDTSEIDIHVLRQVRKPRFRGGRLPVMSGELGQYYYAIWIIGAVTALGAIFEPLFEYQAVGFLYLLAVLGIATLGERGPAILSAILSALVWNYFFIPPKYTFRITEVADVMMCFAYLAVAVATSLLTTKIRRQSVELRTRASQMTRLYDFSRELARSTDVSSIIEVASRFAERTIGGACTIFVRQEDGKLREEQHTAAGFPIGEKHRAVASWVSEHQKRAGFGTDTLSGSDVFCLPVKGGSGMVGVLLFFPKDRKSLSVEEETTLESVCASVAISIEREEYQKATASLRIVEESQKLYQTILDSVSHEMRTPITSIMGAASALQDGRTAEIERNRISLTEDIVRGAQRLNHVVENLLDTSRMSTGQLTLKKDLVELSESVETIVREWKNFEQVSNPLRIEADVEVYAAVDTRLLRNALGNLLDNALNYSPKGSEISVRVGKDQPRKRALIEVADRGKGIPVEDRERIFQRFYRVAGTPAGGIGLGLSIVKGIVDVHGGAVEVAARADPPGSVFRIELPLWEERVPVSG